MPLDNFGSINPSFFRCAQPDASGSRTLGAMGVTYIVRLNDDGPVPVADEHVAAPTILVSPRFIPTFSVDLAQVVGITRDIKSLIDSGEKVVVHCTHGRDRTGLIVGIYRLLFDGWTIDQVDAERKLYGVDNVFVAIGDHAIHEALEAVAKSRLT